jgi:hypothetical protein
LQFFLKYQQPIKIFLILLFAAVLACSVFRDYKNYKDGYACDLRKRIAGSRYMNEGYSPYFFKWSAEYPSELCIQYEGDARYKQNLVTLPPSYLWLLQPLAKLQFPLIEKVWFCFQYVLLLTIFALFYFKCSNETSKCLLLLSFSLMLLAKGWIRNIDIGQSYMIFPLLLSLMYLLFKKHPDALFYFGIIIGIGIWLRPSLIFFVLPFFFTAGSRRFFIGLFTAGAICMLQVLVCGHFTSWVEFFKASGMWIQYYSQRNFDNGAGFDHLVYPKVIETQTNFSITNLHDYIASIPITMRALFNIYAPSTVYSLLFLISTAAVMRLLYCKKKIQDQFILLLAGFCIYYLGEIFLWVPKYSYYYVELFFPVCLLIYNQHKLDRKILYMLFTGLFLSAYLFKIIPMQLLVGEYIIAGTFFICIFAHTQKINHNF